MRDCIVYCDLSVTGEGGGFNGSRGYALTTVDALEDDDCPVKLFLSYKVPDLLLVLGSDLALVADTAESLRRGTEAHILPRDEREDPDEGG